MIHTCEKNGETYVDGIDVRFKTNSVADIKASGAHKLTLRQLRAFVDKTRDMSEDTPIFSENITESLLCSNDTGWFVTPLLWEVHYDEKQYSPAVAAWQIFRTVDANGDNAVLITAHY